MSKIIPYLYFGQRRTVGTSKSIPDYLRTLSVNRAPTDPFFYADVTIHKAVLGSRYWLVDSNDHSTVLSTGLITSDPQVLSNIPSYGSPMLILLKIRNASSSPKYKQYTAEVPHASTGVEFYVAQELDE